MYVAESGLAEGCPVVFLHGASPDGGRIWRPQVRDLSSDMRCYVVDLPGHTGSSTVAWTSLNDTADQVAEFIRNKIGGPAGIVGLSLGGCVAIRLAMRNPELVTSAIASGVSILPASFSARVWQRGQLVARYSSFTSSPTAGEHDGEAAEDDAGSRAWSRPVPRQVVMKIVSEIVNFDLPDGRKKIDCAMLAVAGEHENRLVLRSLRPLAGHFAAGRAKYVPDASQHWNAERPELFNAMVRSWVIDQRLPPKLRDPEQWAQ
nr:alpha/beta hydrolase [Phytoactinopolyspora mesophila]